MKTKKILISEYYWYLFALVLAASAILYLLLIGGKYIWADEAYTFGMLEHSYAEMWQITAADVHPPLYYFILKFFTQPFGYNIVATKIVSVIPYIFILAFGGVQFKRFFDAKTSLLFMILFFLFPYILPYSVEIRMYSIAAAFVFANAVYGYRCFIEEKKLNWVFFAIFGTAAAYTHYFALVSVGIVYGVLLIALILRRRSQIKNWALASVGTVILYLPWLKSFVEQLMYKVSNEYWIADITFGTIVKYWKTIFGVDGMPMFALIFSLTYLMAFVYIVCTKRKNDIILCVCALLVPVGTIGIGVMASVLVRPVFVIRYVIPAIPVLVAFMAIALGRMQNKAMIACILSVAFIGGIANYKGMLDREYSVTENVMDEEFVQLYPNCDSYIVLNDSPHVAGVLSYYEKEKPIYIHNGDTTPEANPFDNRAYITEFDTEENEEVLALLNVGERPSGEYFSDYQYEYIGEFVVCRNLADIHYTDVYVLTK